MKIGTTVQALGTNIQLIQPAWEQGLDLPREGHSAPVYLLAKHSWMAKVPVC